MLPAFAGVTLDAAARPVVQELPAAVAQLAVQAQPVFAAVLPDAAAEAQLAVAVLLLELAAAVLPDG